MSATNADIILAALAVTGVKPQVPVRADFATAEEYTVAVEKYRKDSTAYDQQVKANAREIKVMLGERSKISAQLTALDHAMDPEHDGGKVFVGTIVRVYKEENSNRAIVMLHTGTDRETRGMPAGHEIVRTDRTEDPDGRAIARAAQLLIGHRVVVYVELETMAKGDKKVRVVRHIEDQGMNEKFNPETGAVAD